MKIEVLFPEFCQWFGDSANARYLSRCIPDADMISTSINSVPNFADSKTDILILGSMTESQQVTAVERLSGYREKLQEAIEDGMFVIATGNSTELFGNHILDSGEQIPMLRLFRFHAERDMTYRHNSLFLGEFEDMNVVGYKSQFSFIKGTIPGDFIKVTGGAGNSMGDPNEGFRYKNLFATYLLGPFLVTNPPFTKYLLRSLGRDDTLAFEKEVTEAYEQRRQRYSGPDTIFFDTEQ